ncbi:MAG: hypothetical protein OER95_15175, partial [Acidimicrobiia bacterium]|nr:hypothetical protein [Acidimicrobiia bacterium]
MESPHGHAQPHDHPHRPDQSHGRRSHEHSHSPGSSHSHEMEGTWAQWMTNPVLRALLTVLVVAAIVTLIGLAALWPDGSGRAAIDEEASTVGLVSDRYEAVVDSVTDGECEFSSEGNEWECRSIVVIPD